MRADGLSQQSLIAGLAPAWSPDATRIAYECGQDICLIYAVGTGAIQLTNYAAGNSHPTWSPDGLKIAFAATHAGVADLYEMAANGSGVVRVRPTSRREGAPAPGR
jgi:TolB protein